MKDIDIRNIGPVVERRTPEKPGSAEKPAGEKFQKDLDTALASTSTASKSLAAASIEDRAKALEQEVSKTGNQIKSLSNGMHDLLARIKQMRDSKTES